MLSSGRNVIIWDEMLSSGMQCSHLELMLSSETKCYHLGWNVIIWDAMLSSGANVIIWDELLSIGANVIIWDKILSCGANVVILSFGANVIIWCYHVMLSSGMITPPYFIFPKNFTHSSCRVDNDTRWISLQVVYERYILTLLILKGYCHQMKWAKRDASRKILKI